MCSPSGVGLQVQRYTSIPDFYERAGAFLLEQEVRNMKLLGVVTTLIQQPRAFEVAPYFSTVEDGGQVVGAAMCMPSFYIELAHDLCRLEPAPPGVIAAAGTAQAFAGHWHALTGQVCTLGMSMRCFRLEAVTPVRGVPGQMRRITEEDRPMLREWIAGFHRDTGLTGLPPDGDLTVSRFLVPGAEDLRGMFVWEVEGRPVGMAAYTGPTPHGMRVNQVYTPPEHRGRGYASALVAGISQSLLDRGRRFCALTTDLANPTANHIYQAIGYRPVADIDKLEFEPAP